MNGVKKPNDKVCSVSYYRNQRQKLQDAFDRGYMGKKRQRFLKQQIFMNNTVCDFIRETTDIGTIIFIIDEETDLNLTDACNEFKHPFLKRKITEVIDEALLEIFNQDYAKFEQEEDGLIAKYKYFDERQDIHDFFL